MIRIAITAAAFEAIAATLPSSVGVEQNRAPNGDYFVACEEEPAGGQSPTANDPSTKDSMSTKRRQASGAQSDDGAGVSPRVAATVQSQVVGVSGGLALSAKGKTKKYYRDLSRRRQGQAFA